jgi:hypothetical protein
MYLMVEYEASGNISAYRVSGILLAVSVVESLFHEGDDKPRRVSV